MPKMMRSILIGSDMVSREEIKMLYLPAGDRVLSDMKGIFKSEGVLEQYFFELDLNGKQQNVCFCYESAPNESAALNQVASDIFKEIFGDMSTTVEFYGPVLVYIMQRKTGWPCADIHIGDDLDGIIKKIKRMLHTDASTQKEWHGVWGQDFCPLG
jgi:hypothetical protein